MSALSLLLIFAEVPSVGDQRLVHPPCSIPHERSSLNNVTPGQKAPPPVDALALRFCREALLGKLPYLWSHVFPHWRNAIRCIIWPIFPYMCRALITTICWVCPMGIVPLQSISQFSRSASSLNMRWVVPGLSYKWLAVAGVWSHIWIWRLDRIINGSTVRRSRPYRLSLTSQPDRVKHQLIYPSAMLMVILLSVVFPWPRIQSPVFQWMNVRMSVIPKPCHPQRNW